MKALLSALVAASLCRGAITLIDHKAAGAASMGGTATTAALNCTGANAMKVVSSDFNTGGWDASMDTITDSLGNVYSHGTPQTFPGTTSTVVVWYKDNATVSGSMTVSGTGSFNSIFVACFSVVKTTAALDQQSGAVASSSTIQPGSATPSENNELIIAGLSSGQTSYSINGGFTITDQLPLVGGNHMGGALAYLIQTSAAAANPTWTINTADQAATVLATFKSVAGGGGSTTQPRHSAGTFQ